MGLATTTIHTVKLFCAIICIACRLTVAVSSHVDSSSSSPSAQSPIIPAVPSIQLRNGVQMPAMSLGTAHVVLDENTHGDFKGFVPERAYRQVQLALEQGIRSFDTARIYRTHKQLAHVLGEWFRLGLLKRDDIFLTTKVFHSNAERVGTRRTHMYNMNEITPHQVTEQVRKELEEALDDLGVGQIDLVLLHWPSSGRGATLGKDCDDGDTQQGAFTSNIHRQRRLAAWKVLEEFYQKGWLRAIGVSNFSEIHLEQLREDGAIITPMVNQIETNLSVMHPNINTYCKAHNIVCQAFSPLRRGKMEEMPSVASIALKYNKSQAQVALRFLYQYGYAITFLSTNVDRMIENHDIFDFELSQEEMDALSALPSPDGSWGLPSPYDLE
uniref:NADP-dependent oxidoreductase domain-containing protein n=1 Tax=Fibrocapsa japonica TaxID=94617 RepID=A0A7S2XZZ6_9STRA